MARLNMLKMIGLAVLLAIALALPTVLPSPKTAAHMQNTGSIAV